MEKKSIFKKIDELYTKVTKVIIGDVPHDGEQQELLMKEKKSTPTQNNKTEVHNTLEALKEKILNLGKPQDEKALLYKEVVKKEKQEAKEAKKIDKAVAKKSSSPKTETMKKTSTKKTKKMTTTKKTAEKNTVKKPSSTKKTTTSKKPSTKNTVEKKKNTEIKADKKTVKDKKSVTGKKKNPTKKTTTKVTKTKDTTITEKPTKTTTKKKVTASKPTIIKITPSSKSAPRGAKKAAKIALYIKDIKKHYGEVDEDFVAIIVKNLGPSIYKKDAELVSCSDPKELDTVRKNFLMKKLGIDASKGVLDAAIQDVCEELKGVRTKYRATFYYALAKKFKKESVLS